MMRIGIVVAGSAYPMDGFKAGLADQGWIEGKNVCFDLRAAEGQLQRLPQFAEDIVGLEVDLIAVIGAVTVRAVRAVTTSIPIVFAVVVESIGDGLASDLEHPGENVTGVTTFDPQQAVSQLGFLKALNPRLERVAILSDRGVSLCLSDSNCQAAQSLAVQPKLIRVEGPNPEYGKAFEAMAKENAQALVVLEEPINQACRKQISDLAVASKLPSVFPVSMVDAQGLFSYGTSLASAARVMAWHADKIFRGAKPGELPIRAALSHELHINLQTAEKLEATVPAELLAQAI